MSGTGGQDWIDAHKSADEALEIAKRALAAQKALTHITMLMLATLAKTAPKEATEQLLAELERVRDMTGPAGAIAGEVYATAVSTLERSTRHD
jgi:ribonuclease BN (tRNA processing enzyme)